MIFEGVGLNSVSFNPFFFVVLNAQPSLLPGWAFRLGT